MLKERGGSSVLAAALLVAGVGGGFLVLVYQALGWFKSSIWSCVSIVTGLQWLGARCHCRLIGVLACGLSWRNPATGHRQIGVRCAADA